MPTTDPENQRQYVRTYARRHPSRQRLSVRGGHLIPIRAGDLQTQRRALDTEDAVGAMLIATRLEGRDMKFLAIHGKGYGGSGDVFPAFVIEADGADEVPTAILPIDGGDPRDVGVAQGYMENYPNATAADIAYLSGPQPSGVLAREDDGMVVSDSGGELDPDDEYHWSEVELAAAPEARPIRDDWCRILEPPAKEDSAEMNVPWRSL